jgi:hypothetical protein
MGLGATWVAYRILVGKPIAKLRAGRPRRMRIILNWKEIGSWDRRFRPMV